MSTAIRTSGSGLEVTVPHSDHKLTCGRRYANGHTAAGIADLMTFSQ
jgi:hypothetical protein